MKPTINQLIEQLLAAKKVIGGDGQVLFWHLPCEPKYFLDPSAMIESIDGKISQDKTSVSFEIVETCPE